VLVAPRTDESDPVKLRGLELDEFPIELPPPWSHRIIDASRAKPTRLLLGLLIVCAVCMGLELLTISRHDALGRSAEVALIVDFVVFFAAVGFAGFGPRQATEPRYRLAGTIIGIVLVVIVGDVGTAVVVWRGTHLGNYARSAHALVIAMMFVPVLMLLIDLLDRFHRPASSSVQD
jgi:hypothetical protein